MAGTRDKLSGKAKELEGKATGDKPREGQGKTQKKVGDAKDTVRKAVDKLTK